MKTSWKQDRNQSLQIMRQFLKANSNTKVKNKREEEKSGDIVYILKEKQRIACFKENT